MTLDLLLARRMAGAEFLKLRKKRGLIIWSALLAVGTVGDLLRVESRAPSSGRPAGRRIDGFTRGLEIVGIFMGPLAAVLIGAEAGAGDSSAGVFRDLVVTGRSRAALFAARVPGALALCTVVVTLAYLALLAFTFGPGRLMDRDAERRHGPRGLLWALLVDGVVCVWRWGWPRRPCRVRPRSPR